MKSNEHIKQLIKLSEENPELEIMAMVYQDCIPRDDHLWYGNSFGKSEIKEYCIPDETFIFDEDDIKESLFEEHESEFENLSKDEIENKLSEMYEEMRKRGFIKKAIFVEINTP